jgi:hypothetical protein
MPSANRALPAGGGVRVRRWLLVVAISSALMALVLAGGTLVGLLLLAGRLVTIGALLAIGAGAGVILASATCVAALRARGAVIDDTIRVVEAERACVALRRQGTYGRFAGLLIVVAAAITALAGSAVSRLAFGVMIAISLMVVASVARGTGRRLGRWLSP